jgi:hypothetical protein
MSIDINGAIRQADAKRKWKALSKTERFEAIFLDLCGIVALLAAIDWTGSAIPGSNGNAAAVAIIFGLIFFAAKERNK